MSEAATKNRGTSEEVVLPSRRSRRLSRRREDLRDSLWPDGADIVWSRKKYKGFTTLPRTIPLVMRLIGDLTPKGDAGRVYADLWFRAFDEGLVTVRDENEMAFAAGYSGPRAARTWRAHIDALVDLGFLRTKQLGNRDIGHILLLDPHAVAAKLNAAGRVSPEWWNAFITRTTEIGAEIPEPASGDSSEKSERTNPTSRRQRGTKIGSEHARLPKEATPITGRRAVSK